MDTGLKKFTFDAIITRIDCETCSLDEQEEEGGLAWELSLKNERIAIPTDRILVESFPSTALHEFHVRPCDLCNAFRKAGLIVTVRQDDKVLGTGKCTLPNFLLSQLFDDTCLLTHTVECEIMKKKELLGVVELNIRITSDLPNKDAVYDCSLFDICRPLDKQLNPRDIMMLLGRSVKSKSLSCMCEKRLLSGSSPQPFVVLQSTKEEQLPQTVCQEHQVVKDLNQIQDVNKFVRTNQIEKQLQTQPLGIPTGQFADDCQMNWPNGQDEAKEGGENNWVQIFGSLDPPDLTQTNFRTPMKCQVCKMDISWLPKLAACPYCGYKSYPIVEDKPYDVEQTAQDVLQRFQEACESQPTEEPTKKNTEPAENSSQSCECKKNKFCARCRIRKLCEEIFEKNKALDNAESAKTESVTPKKVTQSLVKIFDELKGAFEKKKPSEEEQLKVDNTHSPSPITDIVPNEANAAKEQPIKRNSMRTSTQDRENMRIQKSMQKHKRKLKCKYSTMPLRPRKHRIGHRDCLCGYKKVPGHMGWHWKLTPQAHKCKWRPGAIARPIRNLMGYFLTDFPVDTINVSRYAFRNPKPKPSENEEVESLVQQPTLEVCKKNDEYIITLRPLKDPEILAKSVNPYLQMKPVRFRIVKNPKLLQKHRLKKALTKRGFAICSCKQPVEKCFCRSLESKKELLYEITKQSQQLQLPPLDDFVFSDVSDSGDEFDFGVTPPAGLIKPELRKKPDMVHSGTQYEWDDVRVQYQFNPCAYDPYILSMPCAYQERKFIEKKPTADSKSGKGKKGRKVKRIGKLGKPKRTKK